jgi:CPA2 family monovalent cation:H+ antiporter-2
VTTVLFRKLRQPVVLGYLLAGMIVGPHIPIPIFVDLDRVHTLSELGVILVMFSVGLEFSIRKLVRVLPNAGVTGLIQLSVMIWLGTLVGQAFGWTARESLFGGAAIAISSTMIVAKTFAEQKVAGQTADLVFGVLVVQDLAAVLLLAILTAVSTGAGLTGAALAASAGKLAAFLVAMIAVGFLIVPRAIRVVAHLESRETLLVASIGVCFAYSLIAQRLGYSVALGAFLAGSLIAESGESKEVEHLIAPVRDVFAAVFFVSVGMIVEPAMLLVHWPAILALTIVVLVGQAASVALGSFLGGNGVRRSIKAGMSLAQIGEFSFIIASTGVALGAVREFLYPVAVAVAVITTFTTPWMIRASDRVATWIDHKLPQPLQTFASIYGTWVERMRARKEVAAGVRPGRLVWLIAIDASLILAIAIGASVFMRPLRRLLADHTGLSLGAGRLVVIGGAVLLASPLLVGLVRATRAFGGIVAALAMPTPAEGEDQFVRPRRALGVTIQLALLALVGVPLVAVTQPFLPAPWGAGVLGILLVALAVSFWRSAGDLDAQVRTGAQAIVAALASQSRDGPSKREPTLPVVPMLGGLGDLAPVTIEDGSAAIGRTLAELEVRSTTGASVIAISRANEGVVAPTGREALRVGDVLTLAGTHEAVDAARQLLATKQS